MDEAGAGQIKSVFPRKARPVGEGVTLYIKISSNFFCDNSLIGYNSNRLVSHF